MIETQLNLYRGRFTVPTLQFFCASLEKRKVAET